MHFFVKIQMHYMWSFLSLLSFLLLLPSEINISFLAIL